LARKISSPSARVVAGTLEGATVGERGEVRLRIAGMAIAPSAITRTTSSSVPRPRAGFPSDLFDEGAFLFDGDFFFMLYRNFLQLS